jgi:RNA polymerase sigma-70 factor (ECF subfamily)
VQNTFLKTFNYLKKGGKIDTMKAFLYHILNNLIIDEYRKNKPLSLDVLIKKGFEPSVDYFPKMMDTLDGKDALLLIKQLPLKYKKVMEMKYIQELNLQEMATLTKQSKNTVTVQLHRGLFKLKKLYREKKEK